MNFSKRSSEKELLDGHDIPLEDIRLNMQELNFINTYLGGHAITIKGFTKLLKEQEKITVCEIGCGGGDNLLAIFRYCKKMQIPVTLIGIDINQDCLAVAEKNLPAPQVKLIQSDYKLADFRNEYPDIIFSSLFCHHFSNEELVRMLQWMEKNARIGFFINDLERHPLAYYAIKWLSALFSKSYLVKNDAPVSVTRGFKRKDWMLLTNKAGLFHFELEWKWAFRWLLTVKKDKNTIGNPSAY